MCVCVCADSKELTEGRAIHRMRIPITDTVHSYIFDFTFLFFPRRRKKKTNNFVSVFRFPSKKKTDRNFSITRK